MEERGERRGRGGEGDRNGHVGAVRDRGGSTDRCVRVRVREIVKWAAKIIQVCYRATRQTLCRICD